MRIWFYAKLCRVCRHMNMRAITIRIRVCRFVPTLGVSLPCIIALITLYFFLHCFVLYIPLTKQEMVLCFWKLLVWSSVCDDTQNLNETESKTFFRYQLFPIPNPILFSKPNIFDTESDTFFETKCFWYRIWYHLKQRKVLKLRSFETETPPKIPKSWTKPNPKLFPIPNFYGTESNTFFGTESDTFSIPNLILFWYQIFPMPNRNHRKKWTSFETK